MNELTGESCPVCCGEARVLNRDPFNLTREVVCRSCGEYCIEKRFTGFDIDKLASYLFHF